MVDIPITDDGAFELCPERFRTSVRDKVLYGPIDEAAALAGSGHLIDRLDSGSRQHVVDLFAHDNSSNDCIHAAVHQGPGGGGSEYWHPPQYRVAERGWEWERRLKGRLQPELAALQQEAIGGERPPKTAGDKIASATKRRRRRTGDFGVVQGLSVAEGLAGFEGVLDSLLGFRAAA